MEQEVEEMFERADVLMIQDRKFEEAVSYENCLKISRVSSSAVDKIQAPSFGSQHHKINNLN